VRPTLPNAPSVPAFSYGPDGNAPQMTVPTATSLAGLPYNADRGLYPTPYRAYDPMAGGPPSYVPGQQSDRGRNLYPWVGGNPFGLVDPQGPYADPTALLGGGMSLSRPANPEPPAPTASEGVLRPNPLDSGGGFTLAGYGAGDPTNRADPAPPSPVQYTSGDGLSLISLRPSANAATAAAKGYITGRGRGPAERVDHSGSRLSERRAQGTRSGLECGGGSRAAIQRNASRVARR